jgi:Ni/Fe-hydrogenase subunit HybB-like protein
MSGEQRPWFGSKRIGYGMRPQTWQGWLVVLGFVAVVVLVALVVVPLLVTRH